MEEEKFNTEADYSESSAPRQDDLCAQVGQSASSEIQVNREETVSRGWENLPEAFTVHTNEK